MCKTNPTRKSMPRESALEEMRKTNPTSPILSQIGAGAFPKRRMSHAGELLGQNALEHLSRRRARQVLYDVHLARDLPVDQALVAGEIAEFGVLELLAFPERDERDDHLAARGVLLAEHGGLGDGGVFHQHFLDLA